MSEWHGREIDWEKDRIGLRSLFKTTWKGHPIMREDYFYWHLFHNHRGRAIGFCAETDDRRNTLAGLYLVIPSAVYFKGRNFPFSTSMYTITHPSYYKRGIFKGLALLTYEKCLKMGIIGTIGIPNKKSLHGMTKVLKFEMIGQFELMARWASVFSLDHHGVEVRKISSEGELASLKFCLDRRKTESGVVMGERNLGFVRWRFFRCPGVSYHVFVALGPGNSVQGLMVLRNAFLGSSSQFAISKLGLPITVVVDFVVDHTVDNSESVVRALMATANRHAYKTFSPLIFVLTNPFCFEGEAFLENGFRRVSKRILPHEINFVLKFHGDQQPEQVSHMSKFENWYFSFADYDIY